MKMKLITRISAAFAALVLSVSVAVPSTAATGYRGDTNNNCRAYIDGSNAWTNCFGATATKTMRTKAWCTAQPTRYGRWVEVRKGTHINYISPVGCTFNVHTATTHAQ